MKRPPGAARLAYRGAVRRVLLGGVRWGLPVAAVLSALQPDFGVALAALAFASGRRRDGTGPALGALAAGLLTATARHAAGSPDAYAWLQAVVVLLLAGALPWACGRLLSDHRELAVAGWRRATDLEREQRLAAAQARLLERARIAQELHDSLGHELSLVALRAGALELAAGPGGDVHAAARALREDVAVAVERLRDAVEVLREGPPSTAPVHESVADLVGRARDRGLDVTLRSTGEPVALAPAADLAVHRVVQEALTNAVRHAPGAAVTVGVEHRAGQVRLRVDNPASAAGGGGAGTGLDGLRERLGLVGGTLVTRREDGRFALEASVPVRGPTPGAPPAPGLPAAGSDTARAQAVASLRVRRALLVAVAAPVVAVAVLTGFWLVATHDATLDAPTYERIALGESRAELAGLLPSREATRGWNGALRVPDDASLDCRFYSDGNYPAAFATYRLCFRDGVLVRKDDVGGTDL